MKKLLAQLGPKTIRMKLFWIFVTFMVCFVAFGVLLNAFFLEPYYIYKNKSLFEQAHLQIQETVKKEALLTSLDRVDGITTMIADREQNIKSSSFLQNKGMAPKLPIEIEQAIRTHQEALKSTTVYQIVRRPDFDEEEIVFIAQEKNGDYIVMKKSMKSIQESVTIATQFYLFLGLLMLGIGSFCIFVFSKTITQPIKEMSQVASGISSLDFDQKVTYQSADELGYLGASINHISDKLSQSLSALQQDVVRRKQLVRNMSHELKTPIGVIKGYAEGLKFGVAQDPQMSEKYCNVIVDECDRMDELVKEMLSLSMLEAENIEVHKQSIDGMTWIEGVVNRCKVLFEEQHIQLETYVAPKIQVWGEETLLSRALQNFITNGLKHVDQDKTMRISLESKGTMTRISVFNTGSNIPENEQSKIWDVFYKQDAARSRQTKGHGLGLSIVSQIANLHEGRVGIENKSNGVLFYIEIPVADLEVKK